MIAQTEAVNISNKQNLVRKNDVTPAEVRRKRQRDEGRLEALQYFEENKNKIRTWMILLLDDDNDGEGEGASHSIGDRAEK